MKDQEVKRSTQAQQAAVAKLGLESGHQDSPSALYASCHLVYSEATKLMSAAPGITRPPGFWFWRRQRQGRGLGRRAGLAVGRRCLGAGGGARGRRADAPAPQAVGSPPRAALRFPRLRPRLSVSAPAATDKVVVLPTWRRP